jgi:Tol biopolymer transport system component
LDWTPDGSQLAFTSEALPKGTSGLSLISISDLTARPLITPPASHTDWGPAFSPDGKRIAFVRGQAGGVPEDLVVMDIATGVIHTLVQQESFILGSPAWTPDGESLVFASNRGAPALDNFCEWRGPAQLEGTGEPVWHPAIARVGDRLAYQKVTNPLNIWEVDPTSKNTQAARVLVSSTAGTNVGAQFSPDGKKLVFMSDRNGSMEIWTSNRDGSNPIQLTTVRLAGTPRWSPDSKTIAFDVGWREHGAIFIVRPDGGVPQPIVQDGNNNVVPSWSRDGRWIYFASDRSGSMQVWKTPLDGGPPFRSRRKADLRPWSRKKRWKTPTLRKMACRSPEIWRYPSPAGRTRVSPILRPEHGRHGPKSVMESTSFSRDRRELRAELLDFSDHRIHSISAMERSRSGFRSVRTANWFDMTSRKKVTS